MNKNVVTLVMTFLLGVCLPALAQTQSEWDGPKKVVPKAIQEAKAKAAAKKAKARAKAEAAQKAKAVNINQATKAELMKLPGITDELAQRIIQNRPYYSKGFLASKNVIPIGTFQGIRKLVYAGALPAKAK